MPKVFMRRRPHTEPRPRSTRLIPIAAARLGRHGVDMALASRRAQELLGDVLWEIVRPDRPSAAYRVGRGLAGDDLRTAIERLERL